MKNEKYNKINNNPYPLLILLSGRERSFSGANNRIFRFYSNFVRKKLTTHKRDDFHPEIKLFCCYSISKYNSYSDKVARCIV
jgi:hypothetical protein